jgi:DNA-binding NarL/FixJ family response regulator
MSKKTSDIRIAIVDDHVLLREGLYILFAEFGFTVLCDYGSGMELRDALRVNPLPDVVLIDIALPEDEAYNTTEWLQEHYPSIKVAAMGIEVNEKDIIRIIHCGAKDYLMKDLDPWQLKDRIKRLVK